MKKEVTVIVATYNRAKHLEHCLKSLELQDYPKDNYRVLIIDDGSNDYTRKIFQLFSGRLNIDYFYQSHQGVGAARRLGIKKAKNEFVAFIDDDCIASKSWLRRLVQIKLDHDIAAAGGLVKIKNPKSIFEQYANRSLFGNGQNWQPTPYDPPFISTNNSIFRRSIVKKIGNFDQNIKVGEDLDMGWRLFFDGYKFNYNPKAVVYHTPPKNFKNHFIKNFCYGRGNARVSEKHAEKLAEYCKNPLKSVSKVQIKKVRGFWPHVWDFLANLAFQLGYFYERKINR